MEGGARVKKTNKKSVTQSLKSSVSGSLSRKGSVIQSLSMRPQSKKLKSVNPSENQSLSARPKSTQIKSRASKKSAKPKVGSINPLILRIKTLDTNLTKVEDALFFLLEIYHDIINDTRGSVADSRIIKTYLEPKLQELCRNLLGLTFDLETNPAANTELTRIYKDILGRLADGVYSDFEKRFHLQLIKFIGQKKSNLEVNRLESFTHLGRIGYLFHDAGHEEEYGTIQASTISTFGNIDQWTKHPVGEGGEELTDLRQTIVELRDLTVGGVPHVRKFKPGHQVRLKFHYFDTTDGRSIVPVYIRIFFHSKDTYKFQMSIGEGGKYFYFPDETPRKHCFSVAEAKEALAKYLSEGECTKFRGNKVFCPYVLAVLAMKAIGDKITFLDAKYHGTTALGVQSAAVTHDRLAAAYLIRDMDKRLEQSSSFRNQSNLVIPVRYYDFEFGARRGLITSNPRTLVIYNKGSGAFRETTAKNVAREAAYYGARNSSRHYSMGGRNAIEHIQSLAAQGVSLSNAMSIVQKRYESLGPAGLKRKDKKKSRDKAKKTQKNLKKKKKFQKRRNIKKQRTQRKKI